jgi:hypothetical protein
MIIAVLGLAVSVVILLCVVMELRERLKATRFTLDDYRRCYGIADSERKLLKSTAEAAPELLEACESMVLLMQSRHRRGEESLGPMYRKLFEAVCKAHGRDPSLDHQRTLDRAVRKAVGE